MADWQARIDELDPEDLVRRTDELYDDLCGAVALGTCKAAIQRKMVRELPPLPQHPAETFPLEIRRDVERHPESHGNPISIGTKWYSQLAALVIAAQIVKLVNDPEAWQIIQRRIDTTA